MGKWLRVDKSYGGYGSGDIVTSAMNLPGGVWLRVTEKSSAANVISSIYVEFTWWDERSGVFISFLNNKGD